MQKNQLINSTDTLTLLELLSVKTREYDSLSYLNY